MFFLFGGFFAIVVIVAFVTAQIEKAEYAKVNF